MNTAPAGVVDIGQADVQRAAEVERRRLQDLGVGPGHTVAWLGQDGLRALALLQACGALGARYLPLNWRLAGLELARIVMHAGVQQLLHDETLAPLAQAVQALAALPCPLAEGHQDGDLMLVYTSGTTGEPKGVIHTAAGMAANIAAAIDAQGLGPHTRTLAVLPLFHVGGLCIQVLPTLAAGGRVRLHARFDPGAWLRDVADWRPSTSLLVPAVMRALVEHPGWAGADLSSLAFVNSGSQIVPVPWIQAFHDRGVPVCQVYGSTETGPVSVVLRPDEAMAHVGQAGRPALGVKLRLADDGEILLQGANLMRGYHGQHEPAFDAQGWFHTGDLGRLDADGWLQVVGRSKELIISGGENIHPAEIENLLAGHPDIAECAVIGLPDAQWGEVPVLALVARPQHPVDLAALQALFDARLARFKHPRRWLLLPELPRTALGKLQRGRLADALSASQDIAPAQVPQAGPPAPS